MSNSAAETICYNSRYEHGVDPKRRVQVPAKWRSDKAETEFTVVVWPKAKEGICLRVLPPEKLADLLRSIQAMPNSDPKKAVLKRYIGSKSEQVLPDKAGRICLPEAMAREAGIADQVILVGVLDCFEIWNPDRYRAVETTDAVMAPEAIQMME